MADIPGNRVRLTLDYDKDTGVLSVDGAAPCIDMAINICLQAVRSLETQLRIATAHQMQQQALEQKKNQEIAAMLRTNRA